MSQAKNLAKLAQNITSQGVLSSAAVQGGGGGGGSSPKITGITYPGNDTAAGIGGGDVIALTGANFAAGAQVVINGAQAGTVTFNSSTELTFTAPANPAGSYILYVVNPDGGTTILVPGIQYSGVPAWTTAAGTLGSYAKESALNLTVVASGDAPVSYTVYSGDLPPGLSLNSSTGAITGTTPNVSALTTYNFVVRATDAQNQDTDRSFSISIQSMLWNFASTITISSTRGQAPQNSAICSTGATSAEIAGYFTATSQTDLYNAITAATYVGLPDIDGYIYFTIPISGTWRIHAQGGGGGSTTKPYTKGAGVQADFTLNAGDVLWISIGHGGGNGNTDTADRQGAGGGGATVVAKASTSSKTFIGSNMTCLLMAAGGYGQYEARHAAVAPVSSAAQGTGLPGGGFVNWRDKAFNGFGSSYGGMSVWGGFGGGNSSDDGYGSAGGYDGLTSGSVTSFIDTSGASPARYNTGILTGSSNNGVVTLIKI